MRTYRFSVAALVAALSLSVAPAGAVVGGTPAAEGEFSWAAAIYTGSAPAAGQYCGGSLVAPRLVVTAAHCVTELLDSTIATLPVDLLGLKVKVLIGRTTLSGTGGEQIYASALHVHPNAPASDVAVIQLASAAVTAPVAFARPADAPFFAPGVTATIAGWGATREGGSGSDRLLKASVPMQSDGQCAGAYGTEYDGGTMLCAGYPQGGTDTCQGDSGGPLVVPGPDGKPLLAGATSFGNGCARAGYPGVYADLAAAAGFIESWA